MRIVYIVLFIVFVGAILIFAFQNLQAVTVSFLGLSVSAPLAVVVLAVYLLGMVSGGAVMSFLRRSIRAVATRSE
jgi:putative membrane protein